MTIDRETFTPPASFNSRPSHASNSCKSENRKSYHTCSSPSLFSDRFHVIHKVPAGDSPYVRAKRVQLIEKDPTRSISLFWRAINTGDRVDSALKDMAVAMKQLDRSDEAIEAIRSFRHLCSKESQGSLDNILIELYKQSGRLEDQVQILQKKLKLVEEEAINGGVRSKVARSQGKKVHITIEQEYSRLLGNLAWVHLEQHNYKVAEDYYRKALSIEFDRNKQCNLAVCLMNMNKIREAKLLLQSIKASSANQQIDESYAKAYERAQELLDQIESHGGLYSFMKAQENHNEEARDFDCQSQVDYLEDMCAIGDDDANRPKTTMHTPKDTNWKSGAGFESSAPRLFTQPINLRHSKPTQTGYSRRYVISGCGTQAKELYRGNSFTSLPCNLQSRKVDVSTDESEIEFQEPNANSEKSSAGSPNEIKTHQYSNDRRAETSPTTVQAAKDFFYPSKSGKIWDDMAGNDKEKDSLDYILPCDGEQHFTSKSSSARRSLSFDHAEVSGA
ncbi:hypothetical protein V2J09_005809 [Rumex salicifolius]